MRRGMLIMVVVVLGLLGTTTAAPAWAHNTLTSSNPRDGSTVAQTPTRITLNFDAPSVALGSSIVILDPAGNPVQVGNPEFVDTSVSQDLRPGSPPGHYTIDWRVVSADGHPIVGTTTFTSRAGSSSATPTADPPATTTSAPAVPSAGNGPLLGAIGGVVLVAGVIAIVAVTTRRRTVEPDPGEEE